MCAGDQGYGWHGQPLLVKVAHFELRLGCSGRDLASQANPTFRVKMASSAGLEPTTACLEGKSSIRLSYEDTLTSAS